MSRVGFIRSCLFALGILVVFNVVMMLSPIGAHAQEIIVINSTFDQNGQGALGHPLPPRLPEDQAGLIPLIETGPAQAGGSAATPGSANPNGGSASPNGKGGGTGKSDPDLQTTYPTALVVAPIQSFDGIGWNRGSPPDPNVAVGATQVVELVNVRYQVFNKSGAAQTLPQTMSSTIFLGMTGECAAWDGGDGIVLYDQIAGRWLLSQLVYPRTFADGTNNGITSNHVCVAVSQTSDATGAYDRYDYDFGATDLPDYPKLGIWPDGYYLSTNTFRNGGFIGAKVCALDRSHMLTGESASAVCIQGPSSWHSLLPSSLDGATPPPAQSPNYFMQFDSGALSLFKFTVNFNSPNSSTFTGPTSIPVGQFAAAGGGAWIPEPGVTDKLESLGDRLMYRLSYRNFGGYESLLVNHTVQVTLSGSSTGQTGIRWYEIRNPGGAKPTVYQQSTFSPDTTTWRWMGSIGQDKIGNMILGYSASSTTLFPSIRYTARRSIDPLNEMEREGTIQTGMGSQIVNPAAGSDRDRWGDYTSVAVDPADDCTLWFVSEYLPDNVNQFSNWKTHLASFKFASCQ